MTLRQSREHQTAPCVMLLRPSALTPVHAGRQIRGLGWISGEVLPSKLEIFLISPESFETTSTDHVMGEAALRLSAVDVAMLGGETPPGPGAGFVFSFIAPDLPAGPVTLRLIVRLETTAIIHDVGLVLVARPDMPASVSAPAKIEPDAIKFFLDSPVCKDGVAVEPVRGFLSLVGWAIGRDGIDRIEVSVDGVSQGRAYHGVRREDLRAVFPGVEAARAGFAMMLPPNVLKPGLRTVRVDIYDNAGRVKEITFKIKAEPHAAGTGPWQLRTKIPQSEIDLLTAMLHAAGPASGWTCLFTLNDATPSTIAALTVSLNSLRWQAYEPWSAILLTDNAENFSRIAEAVARTHADLGPRLRILLPQPPARSSRHLADLADGFLVPLTPGDELAEDALLEMAIEAARTNSIDFLYSDERRVNPGDGAEKAFFKPDFSPDLLLSTNYIGRLWAASTALLRRTDLRESDLRRHGNYDAILRLTEQANQVGHVAKLLVRRSVIQARFGAETPARERAALTRTLLRRNIPATLRPGPIRGTWRVRREIATAIKAHALISIIIPTMATGGLIRKAIGSIRRQTDWPNYEIICLDTIPPNADATQRRWKRWIAANADRVIDAPGPFNWSRLNNLGAKAASGAFLLFLNDDIECQDPTWLAGLVEQAQRPEIGVVGPQLLYPNGRVQHAGIFLARTAGRHAFRFLARDEPGPFGLALIQRDVISVTGAAMLVRRNVFDQVGGFDERHPIVNNDLDFNLRVRAAGLAVIYTPAVSLIHHEAVSRAQLADDYDIISFRKNWGDLFLKGDPFFSRHLSPDSDEYVPDSEPASGFIAGAPLIARQKIQRIVAIKLDHIGDFISAFPAFRRIKHHFPAAELTVVAARASLQLASLEPSVDRVIEFNFFHPRSEKGRRAGAQRSLAALRAQLLPLRFDLAIDLRRQSDTRPILQATGARWFAGFDGNYKYPWLDITLEFEGDIALCLKHGHVGSALVGLIDHVSGQCETDRAVVRDPITRATARSHLDQFLTGSLAPSISATPADKLVCVHTGAGATNKQWPAISFAGLIDLLAGEANASILLIGGPDEAEFAAKVLKSVRRGASVTNLVGRTGLRDLPTLLRAADLFIGNDSGPKHLAAALGVPTIGIHSGTVDAGEWGAVGPHAVTIRRAMICSPCYLAHAADCHRGLACLDGIRVAEVFAACQRMLLIATPGAMSAGGRAGFDQAAE